MITYFKNQKDLIGALISVIDLYWSQGISEEDLIRYLRVIRRHNSEKLFSSEGELNSVVSQRLGKKRVNLLVSIINEKDVEGDVI